MAIPVAPVPAYLPASDAVIVDPDKPRALAFRAPPPDRLLIGGCDPATSVLAAHANQAGVDVALVNCNSSRALDLLKQGRIHVAGTHLGGESTLPAINTIFRPSAVQIVTFASWQQGYVVAAGNPRRITSAAALARRGVTIVNREAGAGSRILLDLEPRRAGIAPAKVHGYRREATGHLSAAWHVLAGLADCCVATEAAARSFGLHFVPIRTERFDFVVPRTLAASTQLERIFDAMQRSAFRRELEILGGYDTAHTGQVVS